MELYYNSLDLSYYDGSRKYYSYVDDDKNYVYQGIEIPILYKYYHINVGIIG